MIPLFLATYSLNKVVTPGGSSKSRIHKIPLREQVRRPITTHIISAIPEVEQLYLNNEQRYGGLIKDITVAELQNENAPPSSPARLNSAILTSN